MNYYLIAGEASGDLHGAALMREIKAIDPKAQFRFWGGDEMEAIAESSAVKHIRELAFMGFVQVIVNLPTILRNINFCVRDIREFQPDRLILIDYPGFNLRIAGKLGDHRFPVLYYISPQLWAWKENRIKKVRRYVDRMICILPFEKEFYDRHGLKVDYVGHPLVERVIELKSNLEETRNDNLIALIPGSRKQEIQRILPTMLELAVDFPDKQFSIAAAPAIDIEFYNSFDRPVNVDLVSGRTHRLMATSRAALVTSGTATLETALFGCPLIVCYKADPVSVFLARRLIKVPYISLVNLIMKKEVVPELIQGDFTVSKLKTHLSQLLEGSTRENTLAELSRLQEKLGEGDASEKAAKVIVNFQGAVK